MTKDELYDKLIEFGGEGSCQGDKQYWLGVRGEDSDLMDYLVYEAFVGRGTLDEG